MSDKIEYPTEDEAQQFSEEFDRIVENTLFELRESGYKVRTDIIMKERNEGESSAVRVGATLYVAKAVESDPEIQLYENPTDAELEEILLKAADYTGTWYHSRVVLTYTGEWTPLQVKVAELDEESGVFLSLHYPTGKTIYLHPHLA
jgi:hypothetical protein